MQRDGILELLEGRARKLRSLAGHILAEQDAFVRWDADGVEEHHAAQEECCREIDEIDRAIGSFPRTPGGSDALPSGRILEELESLRQQVLRITAVHAEFLKRSRRSLSVLANVVQGALGTYEPPKTQFPVEPAREGGR